MTDAERAEHQRAAPGINLEETVHEAHAEGPRSSLKREPVFQLEDVGVAYDGNPAITDVSMDIYRNHITALIGPSGCGKSTLIRCFNRMNDLIPSATVDGRVLYHGQDIYAEGSIPSRSASESAWSSRSRTRSRSRSTTTSRSAPGSSG